ncbi:hypothetical protein LXN57_27585 [Actinoplanes sp. TRM88002]|uniref:Uncharacterized protein n=1 Tax=Paractinoplanes hotanensis TaxID=2906497 RepID=A0ABT0Y5N1_9ACTN|nr:hypothetical protein [Actinoplanes hotanensis]
MGSIQELEQRVTAVEKEQKEVRTLAAGASQDVSDYKAALQGHTSSLNALRETQLEQAADLKNLSSDLKNVSADIKNVSSTVEKVLAELKVMREAQFQQVADMRTMRDTQTRHYVDQQQRFTTVEVGLDLVRESLRRSDGGSENAESGLGG